MGRGLTTPVGLGEHGDCEREDDQEAIGRWYPSRGVAFGATPKPNDALRGAHAGVPRAARGAVRRADELPGERAAAAEDPPLQGLGVLGVVGTGLHVAPAAARELVPVPVGELGRDDGDVLD